MSRLVVDETGEALARLLSHDLRAPLGPLVLAISTLADDVTLDAGTREIASLALGQADRMARLLQATLWTLRSPEPVDRTFDVGGAAREAATCAEAIGVTCGVRITDAAQAQGDPLQMRDALAGVLEVASGSAARVSIDVRSDGVRAFVSIRGGERIDEPSHGTPADARAALLLGARALFAAWGGALTFDRSEVTAWLPVV